MISVFFDTLFSSAVCVPCSIVAGICAVLTVCFGLRWAGWQARDCNCLRRFFRWSGIDEFDDFELSAIIHDVKMDGWTSKVPIAVRVKAGSQVGRTGKQCNGIFNEPVQVVVEQGVSEIVFDVVDNRDRVLARLALDPQEQVLGAATLPAESVYPMRQKSNNIRNPQIKLSLLVHGDEDMEKGLLSTGKAMTGVDLMIQRELQKVKEEGIKDGTFQSDAGNESSGTDMELLMHACCGPLELLGRYGGTTRVYAAVRAKSRYWVLEAFRNKEDQERGKRPVLEIEMLKVVGVQSDPSRHNIFVISYVDDRKAKYTATFRRVDKARDVWVNMLQLLVSKTRDAYKARKSRKYTQTGSTGSRSASPEGAHAESFVR